LYEFNHVANFFWHQDQKEVDGTETEWHIWKSNKFSPIHGLARRKDSVLK
jgi:hypothetical protein